MEDERRCLDTCGVQQLLHEHFCPANRVLDVCKALSDNCCHVFTLQLLTEQLGHLLEMSNWNVQFLRDNPDDLVFGRIGLNQFMRSLLHQVLERLAMKL